MVKKRLIETIKCCTRPWYHEAAEGSPRAFTGRQVLTQTPGQQLWRSRVRHSMLMVRHMVAKVAPKRELGKEGSGHVIDPVVGSQGPEIFHIGPEITG